MGSYYCGLVIDVLLSQPLLVLYLIIFALFLISLSLILSCSCILILTIFIHIFASSLYEALTTNPDWFDDLFVHTKRLFICPL